MWVTFRTQQLATYAPPKQVEVTKHLGDEGVDATGKVVTVSLTQADTLLLGSLSPDEDQQVEVQIRGIVADEPALEGEEDYLNQLNSESELNVSNGGNDKIQAIIEHAANGDMSFDDIMAEWNQKWSDAQESLGIEVTEK